MEPLRTFCTKWKRKQIYHGFSLYPLIMKTNVAFKSWHNLSPKIVRARLTYIFLKVKFRCCATLPCNCITPDITRRLVNSSRIQGKLKLPYLASSGLIENYKNVLTTRRRSPNTSSSKTYHCVAIVTLILIKYTAPETFVYP